MSLRSAHEQWQRFAERNQGAVLRNATREAISRLYVHPSLRSCVTPFFNAREPEKWLFMAGCYNSGTTILREILGAHPQISTLPREGVRFTSAFPDLEANGWRRMWHKNLEASLMAGADPAKVARQAGKDWAPWWDKSASIYLEKSITHGSRMPFLQDAFPKAHFVGIIRNGYCASEGILRRAAPIGKAAEELGNTLYPPSYAGKQWVVSNEIILRDAPLLENYLGLRYEEFADDPIAQVTRLFEFLSVDPSVLTNEGNGAIKIAGRPFQITNMNSSSLARLKLEEIVQLNEVIAPMMNQLGYPIQRAIS